ncbi:uncharacterized protein [Canis lupus baileyi]|uniref:uncharacterized protein n=1 Tax=Canis lupus baileyi TaxID=143281 RepID=UPI003B977653
MPPSPYPAPPGTTTRLKVGRDSRSTATLLAGLQAAAHKPTNLAKVYDVRQGKDESPAAFLERIIEAFRQYTPMNPEAPETKAAIIMAFVNQAARDIKKKLQRVERLREKSLQDLVIVAERVYNNRESPEEQKMKLSDQQTRNLAKILLATTMDDPQERRRHLKKLASGTDWDPLCMTIKKFWHRCTESEISRTSHCRMQMPPGTRMAAVSSEKESDMRG